MTRTGLIRLGGLATMIGSVVFALVLLSSPWLAQVAHDAFGLVGFMEAVVGPVLGFAIFRAGAHQAGEPSRVR